MTVLKYFGGKSVMKNKIIPFVKLADYTKFCSPFAGACGVEANLNHLNVKEFWNDIDYKLTNFYNVVKYPETFKEFVRFVELTPFSEKQFDNVKNYFNLPLDKFGINVESAVNFFLRNRLSKGGEGKQFVISTNRLRRNINEQVSAYLSAIDGLYDLHKRISLVEIRCMDFEAFIRKYDSPETFFYCDPTYLKETRVGGSYDFEMTREDHVRLLTTLRNISGKFLLHGYDSSLYRAFAETNSFVLESFDVVKSSSFEKTNKNKATEIMIMNYR